MNRGYYKLRNIFWQWDLRTNDDQCPVFVCVLTSSFAKTSFLVTGGDEFYHVEKPSEGLVKFCEGGMLFEDEHIKTWCQFQQNYAFGKIMKSIWCFWSCGTKISSHNNSVPEQTFALRTEHMNHSSLLFLAEQPVNTLSFADSQNGPSIQYITSRSFFFKPTQRTSANIACRSQNNSFLLQSCEIFQKMHSLFFFFLLYEGMPDILMSAVISVQMVQSARTRYTAVTFCVFLFFMKFQEDFRFPNGLCVNSLLTVQFVKLEIFTIMEGWRLWSAWICSQYFVHNVFLIQQLLEGLKNRHILKTADFLQVQNILHWFNYAEVFLSIFSSFKSWRKGTIRTQRLHEKD